MRVYVDYRGMTQASDSGVLSMRGSSQPTERGNSQWALKFAIVTHSPVPRETPRAAGAATVQPILPSCLSSASVQIKARDKQTRR